MIRRATKRVTEKLGTGAASTRLNDGWIECPDCKSRLAREESDGNYVVRLSRGKNRKTVIKIFGGSIECTRCGRTVSIPVIDFSDPTKDNNK